jgi:hypothetical protein
MNAMRARWRILFLLSLTTLIGWAWLAQRYQFSLWNWFNIDLIGMIIATGVAFHSMVTNARQPWRAWIAIVAVLPAAFHMWQALPHITQLVESLGVPGTIIFAGTFGTLGWATFVACASLPPPPREDPIARAEVRR